MKCSLISKYENEFIFQFATMEVDEGAIITPERRKRRKTTKNQKRVAQRMASAIGTGTSVAPVTKYPHLFHDKYTVRLTYADCYYFDITPGTAQSQLFRPFSIYDIDQTGVGHQPFARDLWAAMYDYYSVIKTEVKFHFINCYDDTITYTDVGTSAQCIGNVCATVTHSTTTTDFGGDFPYPVLEQKNNTSKLLIARSDEKNWAFSRVYTPDMFKLDAKDADSDNTWTAMGSNPNQNRYVGFTLNSTEQSGETGASETANIRVQVLAQFEIVVQFAQVIASLRYTTS